MKSTIKRLSRSLNATSLMVEETAISGAMVMAGVRENADQFRKGQIVNNHFKLQKRLRKWQDKATKQKLEMPVIDEYKP